MKTISAPEGFGITPQQQAKEIAIKEGFNCYSKPPSREAFDHETETEDIFYYKWQGKMLQVSIIKQTPGFRNDCPEVVTLTDIFIQKPAAFTQDSNLLANF